MDITWYGHSCFRITERNYGSVVCDPYDYEKIGYEPLKLKADIVTMSNDKPGHSFLPGIKTDPFVINRPGEYEINNIFIKGHATNKKGDPRNTIFVIEINGTFVAHLGNITRLPTQTEVESLGDVHVLLIPVGGGAGLNAAQAVETMRMIQPKIVIPMHYSVARTLPELDPLSKFLKEMGISQVDQTYTTFKVPPVDKLLEDMQLVILDHPLGNETPDDEDEKADADAA
ncbi:MAG: MBL fold metallo-hydrolase [Anaerolineaceae bacterium]|nr:MBL fold metallo-hydrolase [Anaerolineaceae bacterium]